MNLHKWNQTAVAIVAAASFGVFAGCEQEATDTYEFPDTDTDLRSPGDTGTDTQRDTGDVGPMGTTDDQGMIGGDSDTGTSTSPGDTDTGTQPGTDSGTSGTTGGMNDAGATGTGTGTGAGTGTGDTQ